VTGYGIWPPPLLLPGSLPRSRFPRQSDAEAKSPLPSKLKRYRNVTVLRRLFVSRETHQPAYHRELMPNDPAANVVVPCAKCTSHTIVRTRLGSLITRPRHNKPHLLPALVELPETCRRNPAVLGLLDHVSNNHTRGRNGRA